MSLTPDPTFYPSPANAGPGFPVRSGLGHPARLNC
jgi:hypothetical protein